MFEGLAKHRKILVVGRNRSGTTICATMISKDTGHGLVREELCYFTHQGVKHWIDEVDAPLVIQAPFATDICHQFPGVCVVFMMRDQKDIDASRERTKNEDGSNINWGRIDAAQKRRYHADIDQDTAKVDNWVYQKQRISFPIEVEYESLRQHPLWVDKPFRERFHVRQTSAVA